MTPDALRAVLDKRPGTENMAAPGPDAELRARVAVNLIGPALAEHVAADRLSVHLSGPFDDTGHSLTDTCWHDWSAALAAFDAALERE